MQGRSRGGAPEVKVQRIEGGDYSKVDFKKYLVLQSNDPKPVEFVVSRNACQMSGLIRDMLDPGDGGLDEEGERTTIPASNVNGRTLVHVISYCEHHWNNPAEKVAKPLQVDIKDVISAWDYQFLFGNLIKEGEATPELLFEVMLAANFLNIKDLLDLTIIAIMHLLKGKNPDQVRAMFGNNKSKFPLESVMGATVP
eukprot:Hpha_TRINITY_DN23141_c0_g1::TRINITY_DN23141_c0_g1_i1::g.29648::m.29648/K03094/SKP1, CBF3D; S-phase kinase-associated protein 1